MDMAAAPGWGTVARVLVGLTLSGCSSPMFRMTDGSSYRAYVTGRKGGLPGTSPSKVRFKPEVCEGHDLRPESRLLSESHLLEFLGKQGLDVQLERPRADLVYVIVSGAGTQRPVRLRVALLKTADEAGVELNEAILQHGEGSWGVRRSNLAVLGPIGSLQDDVTFAAKTKLSCWGMFMTAGRDHVYAVSGAYREL